VFFVGGTHIGILPSVFHLTFIHFLLNSTAQKLYLKLYCVSIPPPTVSQMDQDLLDNNWKMNIK